MSTLTRSKAVARLAPGLVRREWVVVLGCYLALGMVFLWSSVWSGAVPLPLMNPYLQPDPVWSAYAPEGAAVGGNLLLGDVSGFYYPYLVFTIASLGSGHFPLWNPHLYGGMPYFAANQAAILFPINLLSYWLGPHQYWAFSALLRIVVAGCGTYLLVRRLGVGALAALLGGGVYSFAAFNVVWLQFAIHNVAALLPAALWLILRLIEQPGRSGALALAGMVAAQMLGGHPEMSLFFMVVCAGFAVAWLPRSWRAGGAERPRWWQIWRGWRFKEAGRPATLVALAFGLGLGLSAAQWVPTAVLIQRSATLEERSFAVASENAVEDSLAPLGGVQRASWGNLRHWLLLLAPELWGTPRGERIRYWLAERANYNEMASYVGVVTLPLAFAGMLRGANRRAARCFGALLLISLLLLYPLPGLYRVAYLPLFDVAHGFRFGLGVTLAAAVLAAMGLEWLASALPRARMALALALALLASVSLAIVADLWMGQRVNWTLGFVPGEATRAQIAQVYAPGNWRLFLPAAAGGLAMLALLATPQVLPARAGTLALAGIALGELLGWGYGYNGFTPPSAIYPETAAIAALRRASTPTRVLPLDGALWANSAMTQGVQVTGGLDDLLSAEQHRFIKRGMAGIVRRGDEQVLLEWGQRFMTLMNAGYVLSERAVVLGDGRALPLELEDGAARLARYGAALPRAYAATSVVQATPRTAEDAVYDAGFDPRRAVVLEEPPPIALTGASGPVQPVPILAYTPNRVELAPELPAPAVVVLADSFDPDWQVTIDGAPARLLRANAIFRGVLVPAGRHHVVFHYRPRAVALGGVVSLAALAGCVALALWPRGRRQVAGGRRQ